MKKEYILVIDSGVGGLSTLSKIYQFLPANYIYFADNKHAPYGNHSNDEICDFLEDIIFKFTQKYSIYMVVLACNTATTSAISKLRKRFYNLAFVGTEPAIKLAIKNGCKAILSLTTPATSKQNRYKILAKNQSIKTQTISMFDFAFNIENYLVSKSFWMYFCLQKNLAIIANKSRSFDCLVLGCTHYVLIKDLIKKYTNLKVFDGNLGVAKQVLFLHAKLNLKPCPKPSVCFFFSEDQKHNLENYKKIFYEILANSLKLW